MNLTTIVRKLTVANRDACLRIVSISLKVIERLQNLLLGCGRESLQITLEAAREMDGKTNWHAVLASLTGA